MSSYNESDSALVEIDFPEPIYIPTYGYVVDIYLAPSGPYAKRYGDLVLHVIERVEGIDDTWTHDQVYVQDERVLYAIVYACRRKGWDVPSLFSAITRGSFEWNEVIGWDDCLLVTYKDSLGYVSRTYALINSDDTDARRVYTRLTRWYRRGKATKYVYASHLMSGTAREYVKLVKLGDERRGWRLP